MNITQPQATTVRNTTVKQELLRGSRKVFKDRDSQGTGGNMTDRAEDAEDSGTQLFDQLAEALKCEEDPKAPGHPSQLELAQCEADMGTLLRIIAELNEKMTGLQPPRCLDKSNLQERVMSTDPEAVPASIPMDEQIFTTSPNGSVTQKEESVELQLQEALDALETSVRQGRAWVTPHISCNKEKPAEHLTAATESWAKVTQVLDEMEREFGFSSSSELPAEEHQKYQKNVLALHKRNCTLRATLHSREEELDRSKVTLSGLEEERNRLQMKILSLQITLPAGVSMSPPTSPSSSSSEAWSPYWATPPYPGSPQMSKRSPSAFPALSAGGSAPSASAHCSPSGGTDMDHLQRCVERLKARNKRLSAALERRKGESEQMSMILSKHEADHTALQMALKYSEDCEEAYCQLMALYEAKRQGMMGESRETAESGADPLPSNPKQQTLCPETKEASTWPPKGAGVARVMSSVLLEQERGIRERISMLKRDRAAVCIPELKAEGEGQLSPDTGTLARCSDLEQARPHQTSREKAALLYDLVTVREKMSELRGTIRLMEREKRYLEWTLTAQKEQDVAGALIADCLRDELEDRQAEERFKGTLVHCGRAVPGPRNRTILRETQAAQQREQLLKRRVTALRESLDAALADSATRRRYCEEEMAQLALTHSKTTGTYRSMRHKFHEQLWQLEKQAMATSERHATQIAGLKATLEALETKREETVL
ncbi:colorectal mutant cancer protein [Brienomyrus brachyistius]|uniref:colorectal mutant cancer protein n=1 Tax=Brienomyrus brachyistius TaxID=42636 RepID=UPI0020B2B948|nr:colorectal mutant cancer protein [Brienomyrus brachyistius]